MDKNTALELVAGIARIEQRQTAYEIVAHKILGCLEVHNEKIDLILKGRCQVDERRVLITSGRLRCLCDISNRDDLAPDAEGGVAGGPVLVGSEAMAAELEMVVDAGVG